MLGCHSSNNLCLEPNDADCQSPCAAEVAQQVKVLAAQPDELSRAPQGGEAADSCKLTLASTLHACYGMCSCMRTHINNKQLSQLKYQLCPFEKP